MGGEKTETVTIFGRRGQTVDDALIAAGKRVYLPCGGLGVCGGCRARVKGPLTMPGPREIACFCGEDAEPDGEGFRMRLLCRAAFAADGEAYVKLPDEADAKAFELRFAAETASRIMIPSPGDGRELGVAVDIGTTTVEASLVDLVSGERVAFARRENPQAVYGADVVSRISAAAESEGAARSMTNLIRACVSGMIYELMAPDGAPVVVVGNTVMLSLFAGVDVTPIGRAPFIPNDLFGREVEVVLPRAATGGERKIKAFLPRCVSGYFGSDAVASVLYAKRSGAAGDGGFLLADIGTNGECASYSAGKLRAAAAPAGPALEGGGISCGVVYGKGAVEAVGIKAGELSLTVAGGVEPYGICGTGLIDAAACMLSLGVLGADGRINTPDGAFALARGVRITQEDIRALSLAKGAVRAAIELTSEGVPDDVPLVLTGAFGSALSAASCARIGLIPKNRAKHAVFVPEGALRGAELILASADARAEAERLAEDAEYIELSGSEAFEKSFLASMGF